MRSQILAGLRRSSENPSQIGRAEVAQDIVPRASLREPVRGSAETVPLIKIVDLKQFQAQRFAKDNLVVSVVGDLTADILGKPSICFWPYRKPRAHGNYQIP